MTALIEFLAIHGVVVLVCFLVAFAAVVVAYAFAWGAGASHGWKCGARNHYCDGFNAALDAVQEHCGVDETATRRLRKY